jgi:hypothetical protein
MHPALARATNSILSHFGEDAVFLRGVEADPKIVIDRDVQVTDSQGSVVFIKMLATISSTLNPETGDALTVDGKDYLLDVRTDSDGESQSFIVVEV